MFYFIEDEKIKRDITINFVQFITNHMQDTRIVNSGKLFSLSFIFIYYIDNIDVRDNMTHALSAFCYYSSSLHALEYMAEHDRTVLIRTLLTSYTNRPWAVTNLILVRFWQGCGFGFRYWKVYQSKFVQSLRKDRIQGRILFIFSLLKFSNVKLEN